MAKFNAHTCHSTRVFQNFGFCNLKPNLRVRKSLNKNEFGLNSFFLFAGASFFSSGIFIANLLLICV